MIDFISSMFKGACHDCVSEGCVYCIEDVNWNPDVCYCDSSQNRYEGCVAVGSGFEPLESRFDCFFNSQHGEIFLAVASVAFAIIFCCLAVHIGHCFSRCCRPRGRRHITSNSSQRKRTRRPLCVKPSQGREVVAIPIAALKEDQNFLGNATIPHASGTPTTLSNIDSDFVEAEAELLTPSAPTYEDIENCGSRMANIESDERQTSAEVVVNPLDSDQSKTETDPGGSESSAQNEIKNSTEDATAKKNIQDDTVISKVGDEFDINREDDSKVLDSNNFGSGFEDGESKLIAQITVYSDVVEVQTQSNDEALDSKPSATTPLK
mmetsp:Transcript_29077/g.43945  ORF Transcript_29077/g.43945 Transcript_29077/m.43945 type:complete len:322 (+) Transcript_29077:86-1051(+)|eukprot:CAMPEP_0178914546 /NCGR_PEP_ID=MMETSP0786-20121207/11490_1 /TAXON_ID=186022 /ORGANISM="Thalassionema frauenfeldii, Strain CCMP 1798" /LENGTH=321 /DNA_ID=CAMNT_0020587475 /DNA_START=66 /DNA_END=1031 /DNA_ORIENTATION=-